MTNNIKQNYFTGAAEVPLTHTLEEAQVLFTAHDDVKALGESGELSEMHKRVEDLSTASHTEYMAIRDKLQNIIRATQSKEDELYDEINEDFPIQFYKHDPNAQGFLSVFSN